MDSDVSPPPSPTANVPRARRAVPRVVTYLLLLALAVFIGWQGRALRSEWDALQRDRARARRTAVIGYYNVSVNPSYARKPDNWYHDEGEETLLWSNWEKGEGHHWFHVGRGDVERSRITLPIGRDVIRAVDYPLVENGGGTIWKRIPDEAMVVGHDSAGFWTVYPIMLLDKVWVVNDRIDDHASLVTYFPRRGQQSAVQVYDPILDGRRLTMGLSGYMHDGQPLLYDRGTESLWVTEQETLRAIAGRHKGATLRLIGHPTPLSWSAWRSLHPRSRLLVGADRSQPQPSL